MKNVLSNCVAASMVLVLASIGVAEAKGSKTKPPSSRNEIIKDVAINIVAPIVADGLRKGASFIKNNTKPCKGSGSSGTANSTAQTC